VLGLLEKRTLELELVEQCRTFGAELFADELGGAGLVKPVTMHALALERIGVELQRTTMRRLRSSESSQSSSTPSSTSTKNGPRRRDVDDPLLVDVELELELDGGREGGAYSWHPPSLSDLRRPYGHWR